MSSYPQFADFNSQVVEQANSILQRTKSSFSYMNKENFMDHYKLLQWYWNRKKIRLEKTVRNYEGSKLLYRHGHIFWKPSLRATFRYQRWQQIIVSGTSGGPISLTGKLNCAFNNYCIYNFLLLSHRLASPCLSISPLLLPLIFRTSGKLR